MKGDFSQVTFDPAKHYTGVLKQQGRVDLDADWNEQLAIQRYLDGRRLGDVIGPYGSPKDGGGFAVEAIANGDDLQLAAGRLYVGGLLVETDAARYADQPFFPAPPALAPEDGRTDLVFLDVWEHHITALEDPDLREVALGGPDTTTRVQTVWQVRVRPGVGDVTCEDEIVDWPPPATGGGRLSSEAEETPPETDPCTLNPAGGFRGLENQLYRVEIHEGGDLGSATFKWSRDNGALTYAVETFEDGQPTDRLRLRSLGRDRMLALHVGDWVEVLDDHVEWSDEPGTLAEIVDLDEASHIVTLDRTVDGLDPDAHPKLRRWDQGRDALTVEAGPIALEEGVQVRFSGDAFRTGDHWSFAARTVTGEVESLDDAPPQGIVHHYAPLALVTWATPDGGQTWEATVQDCRRRFPSLTTLCAEDVCFDNDACDLPGADTVQAALDILCRQRDLRHHNRHLHGWGIVCGLQVHCGPDEGPIRRFVTVRDGYALDCEGNDILLEEDATIDLLQMIRQWPGEPLLDDEGNGDVCLTLDAGPGFAITPYEPEGNDARTLLAGTLLLDVYEHCIERLVDFVREEFTIPEGEQDRPAGPAQERVAAFTNLMAQPVNPVTGQHIFLSRREHGIMRDFYDRLRALLQSQTYCAMFDNARPFPDYPAELDEAGMDTAFGKSFHTRLRLRPGSREGYTVGPGLNPLNPSTSINRFDLAEKRLLSQIDPLAGVEAGSLENDSGAGAVQDVAFSPDGRRLFVIVSSRDEEDTFFREGRFGRDGIVWQPLVMICGVKLVTLAVTPADGEAVYAVGMRKVTNDNDQVEFRGTGLYRILPADVDPDMEPLVPFNASGHLRITGNGRAVATAVGNLEAPALPYDRLRAMRVPDGATLWEVALGATGSDDIALATGQAGREETVYAVVGPQDGQKRIVAHRLSNGGSLEMSVPVANTALRLEAFVPTRTLLITSADGYNVQMIDLRTNEFVEDYLLPMQVGPAAIASDAAGGRAYVLNTGSNTITTIERTETLRPDYRFPLDVLAAYRSDVINAFTDLLGGLLQYLKDCLCDHFLVDCPTCTGEEQLFLACVSIREGQVERVCNFSRRRYVKSFPTVGYWLSLVPLVPMIDRLIEQFCCIVLPDLFGRYTAQPTEERYSASYQARVSTPMVMQASTFLRTLNLPTRVRDVTTRTRQARGLATDRLRTVDRTPPPPPRREPPLVNRPVERVAGDLEAKGVTVRREPYDPAKVGQLSTIFRTPPPGSEVTLFEEKGQVKYYAIRQPPAEAAIPAATEARLAEQAEALSAATTQLETLQTTLAETRQQLDARNEELSTLRSQVERVLARPGAAAPAAPSAEEISAMRSELADLRRFREEVTRFMRESRE